MTTHWNVDMEQTVEDCQTPVEPSDDPPYEFAEYQKESDFHENNEHGNEDDIQNPVKWGSMNLILTGEMPHPDSTWGRRLKKFHKCNIVGQSLVNAVTGDKYPFQYGFHGDCGLFSLRVEDGKDGALLFYDSPEQAESHRGFQLSKKFKDEWHRKQRRTAAKSA